MNSSAISNYLKHSIQFTTCLSLAQNVEFQPFPAVLIVNNQRRERNEVGETRKNQFDLFEFVLQSLIIR